MIAKLKEEFGHFQHEILERLDRIRCLTKEVEAERHERLDTQDCARSDRLAAQTSNIGLEEERSAHKTSLANIQSLEARLAFLESEAYRVEIVEKYHDSPIGKVEVSLACKAGFDYLLERLPRESQPAPDHLYYPSRVTNCLDFLKEIEMKGGGIVLDVDNRDGGNKESGEDSDNRDEEAGTTPALSTRTP